MITPKMPSELRAEGGLKWTFYDEDVLAAWVAEMDFGLAPSISDALHDAVQRADTGYPYPLAGRLAAEAAASFWADRLAFVVDPDRVFAAPDVVEGTRRAIVHLTRAGSPVVLHTPAYFPFFPMVAGAGRDLIEVTCKPDDQGVYRIDLDALDAAFAGGAGSMVLCNPWNPTGRSLTEDEIGDVVEVAARHRARVIVDEIHAGLTFGESEHVSAATLDPETVVTVTSASKAWNLPGLKCAQVVLTNDEDHDIWLEHYPPENIPVVGASTFGLIANAAAYSGGRDWLDGAMALLESNRSLLTAMVGERLPRLGYVVPEATYLAWLDFASYGITSPAAYLLEHGRVALTEGAPFGFGGETHGRLNFATHPEILVEVIERIAAALGD